MPLHEHMAYKPPSHSHPSKISFTRSTLVSEYKLTFVFGNFNMVACLENSCCRTLWSSLLALRALFDQPVPNFPATKAAIDALDGKLQALLACLCESY